MLGLKLNHVSKRGHRKQYSTCFLHACISFQEISFHLASISEAQSGAFCGLKSLRILKLDYPRLNRVPELTPVKLTLRELYLSNNQLETFPNNYFEGFVQLGRLEVAHNHLAAVPSLEWLTSTLKILTLGYNSIISLDGISTQVPFKKLAILDLNENEIHEFDIQILSKMPTLKSIFLGQNRMRHLDDYRPFFPHPEIQLYGNPFHCDTKIAWISTTVNTFSNQPTCATPWCLRGRIMRRMSEYFNYKFIVTTQNPCCELTLGLCSHGGVTSHHRISWRSESAKFGFNTLRPRQNGRHFADDIFKCIFLYEMYEFRLKFHWSLFLRVQLTIFQHWFR